MTNSTNKPNVWFWIIGVIALIWNLLGVDGFIGQAMMSDRFKSMYNEKQLEIINNLPSWYLVVFGVAVIASALACNVNEEKISCKIISIRIIGGNYSSYI